MGSLCRCALMAAAVAESGGTAARCGRRAAMVGVMLLLPRSGDVVEEAAIGQEVRIR